MAIDPKLTREDLERQKFDFAGDGAVRVTFSGVSDGGPITDGASDAIKATVLDLAGANPLTVALVDAAGAQVTSFGGGTEYTEDAAAAANPVGPALILVRKDTPAAEVTTDGDNIAQRGTNFGAAYVTLLDAAGAPVSVGGGTQYTEDAAAAANPIGTVPILIRKDTPSSEVTTDGDNVAQRGTNFGAAYVTLLDAAGAPVAVGGGTQYAVDAALGSTPTGTLTVFKRDDALSTLTPVEGDAIEGRVNSRGAIWMIHDGEITAALSATDNAVLDAIAASVAAIDLDTTTLIGHVDGIEALLTTIDGRVDGIEALIGTTNTTLTTIDGRVDGIETLLAAIDGHVDGIEGSVDGIEALLTTIDGRVDGIETLIGTTNTTLTTIDGRVDGIEGILTTIDADTGSIMTSVQLIDDAIFTDDAAFTPGTSKVMGVGFQADETSTDSVDEGDVGMPRMTLDRRVRVANKCIDGPGEPVIDSYTRVAINLAAGANQLLVSSAANKQIWVYGYHFMVNVAGTVSFQDEDDTAQSGIMPFGDKGGASVSPSGNFAMPIWKLATDKDLEVDVVTSELDGWLSYAIVSV